MNPVSIIQNGASIGIKNFPALLVNALLWILTFWIPYLNVGTTIGLIGLVPRMSKKEENLSFTEIFNPAYRKSMGEFFILYALFSMAVFAGFIFMIAPGYVIAIAFGQAFFLLVDKGLNPMQALNKSNQITYGKKWSIFLAYLLFGIVFWIALLIVSWIGSVIHEMVGAFLVFVLIIFVNPILLGISAYIYGELVKDLEVSQDFGI